MSTTRFGAALFCGRIKSGYYYPFQSCLQQILVSVWFYEFGPWLITFSVLGSLFTFTESQPQDGGEDLTFLLSFFAVSLVITFTGTSLIILRILTVTHSSPLTSRTSAYRRIQRILVESGILYTLSMFIIVVILSLAQKIAEPTQSTLVIYAILEYVQAAALPASVSHVSLISRTIRFYSAKASAAHH